MTITLITGANKGIGFETARRLSVLGHVVCISARDVERGEEAAAALGARVVQLDVTDDASVSKALATIDSAEGRLDVLVDNAGVLGHGVTDGPTALRAFDTDAVGIVRVTDAALPLLRKSSEPTVVVVSGSAGVLLGGDESRRAGGRPSLALCSASKAAATMLTVQYAKSRPGIKFDAVEPGTTATDPTAAFGIGRTPEESARVVVRLAALDADGTTGTFQDENGPVPW
jgi:NAD(P)-dependent dehydrogenase (short-subunit alcohol dehydrogenase family)